MSRIDQVKITEILRGKDVTYTSLAKRVIRAEERELSAQCRIADLQAQVATSRKAVGREKKEKLDALEKKEEYWVQAEHAFNCTMVAQDAMSELRHRLKDQENKVKDLQQILRVGVDENGGSCKNEWVGHSLRYSFVFKEMKKVGAIREGHEWAQDMIEGIEIVSERDGGANGNVLKTTIFGYVPLHIRNEYWPSHNDAHMVIDSESEEDIDPEEEISISGSLSASTDDHHSFVQNGSLSPVRLNDLPPGRRRYAERLLRRSWILLVLDGAGLLPSSIDLYDGIPISSIELIEVEEIIGKIELIQSHVRGFLVRRKLIE